MKLVKKDLWLPAKVWYAISINQPQEVKIEKQNTQYDLSLTIEKKLFQISMIRCDRARGINPLFWTM